MSVSFGEDAYALLSAHLGSMVYGVFLVLSIKSLAVTVTNKRKMGKLIVVMGVSTLAIQWMVVTAHWTIVISQCFNAFIYATSLPLDTALYYLDPARSDALAVVALVSIESVLVEAFFIYRTYLFWNRNLWVCVAPTLNLVGLVVADDLFLSRMKSNNDHFDQKSRVLEFISICASLSTSVYCSGMIAYRVWSNGRALRKAEITRYTPFNIMHLVHIIIESAFIYLLIRTCVIATSLAESSTRPIFQSIAPAIMGISFCLVIVRVDGQFDRLSSMKPDAEISIIQPRNGQMGRSNLRHSLSPSLKFDAKGNYQESNDMTTENTRPTSHSIELSDFLQESG